MADADGKRKIRWVGTAKQDLSAFPLAARQDAGHQLWRLEEGDEPSNFKPMGTIGPGVAEIIVNVGDAYRVFYVATFPEAIYVLHAFNKKTQKTSARDKKQGREAYAAVKEFRRAMIKNKP